MLYHPTEERWNTITHLTGLVLAVPGSLLLIISAWQHGRALEIGSAVVYSVSLVLLYFASTAYHATSDPTLKKIFQRLDHLSIFLLIAGSYTPVVLIGIGGWWGWSLFYSVWTLVAAGFLVKLLAFETSEKLSLFLYILMGWLIVVAVKPLVESVSVPALSLIVLGGLLYSAGIIFYTRDHVRYNHAIWHIFVLGGSISHFIAIFLIVLTGSTSEI